MNIAVVWVVGLIMIGLVIFLIARATRPATTSDQNHIQSIMTYSAVTVIILFLGWLLILLTFSDSM